MPACVSVHSAQLISDLELSHFVHSPVVVRTGGRTPLLPPPPSSGRPHQPTLMGLGEIDDGDRPTLTFIRLTPVPERPRPITLVEGFDDQLAGAYRAEAARIVKAHFAPRGNALLRFFGALIDGIRQLLRTSFAH
jgi:hypothetical protein